MHLTGLDLLFWAAGFLANLALLFTLVYRRRARSFPFFAALITLNVVRTIVLYFVLKLATNNGYFYSYWSLALLDTLLELCIVYEVATRVFRPMGIWARDVRTSFVWLVGLSVTIALGLSWLASPPARTWMQAAVTKGTLCAAVLMSELFVLMMAFSVSAGLPWRTHVAKIAQGLGAYSLISVLIETGHSYFGVGRGARAFLVLSYLRMAAYLACVGYWIVMLWPDEEPGRVMTQEMREHVLTLQRLLEYDLNQLRSGEKK